MTREDALFAVVRLLPNLTLTDLVAAHARLIKGSPLATELQTLTHLNLCRARARTMATLTSED